MSTCATGILKLPSPSFISATPPIPNPAGQWRNPSALLRTTARSTPSAPTDAGCTPGGRSCVKSSAYPISFDNGLELSLRRGYNPGEAMLSMVPPAWERSPEAAPELRNFLEEQARVQEAWDGPAALVFTDGCTIGAKLDRNGLRPLRYTLTRDGLLVVGSEVGIADLHGKEIAERQRLGPGE